MFFFVFLSSSFGQKRMSTGHENLSYNVLRMYIDNRRKSPFMESRAAKIRRNRRIRQNIEFLLSSLFTSHKCHKSTPRPRNRYRLVLHRIVSLLPLPLPVCIDVQKQSIILFGEQDASRPHIALYACVYSVSIFFV